MKKLLLVMSLFPLLIQAQNYTTFPKARHAISVNPFALAQLDYTILAGYDIRLKHRLYLSTEAGYIFSSSYIESMDNPSTNGSGFIIRPSVKWFHGITQKFYVQPQVFFKQFTHAGEDWIGKNAVNGVPAYEQYQQFRYRRNIWGINFIGGFAFPLGPKGKTFMDAYCGLGVRYKKSIVVGEPRSIYREPSFSFFANGIDQGWLPSFPAGLRFCYVIH